METNAKIRYPNSISIGYQMEFPWYHDKCLKKQELTNFKVSSGWKKKVK